jgi:hypothetical protein
MQLRLAMWTATRTAATGVTEAALSLALPLLVRGTVTRIVLVLGGYAPRGRQAVGAGRVKRFAAVPEAGHLLMLFFQSQ